MTQVLLIIFFHFAERFSSLLYLQKKIFAEVLAEQEIKSLEIQNAKLGDLKLHNKAALPGKTENWFQAQNSKRVFGNEILVQIQFLLWPCSSLLLLLLTQTKSTVKLTTSPQYTSTLLSNKIMTHIYMPQGIHLVLNA